MTDSSGHSIAVDSQKFSASVHGSLQCSNCHAGDINGYPHPEKVARVDCKTCHADQATQLKSSVHADGKDHPCTSCHGNAHEIYPKTDARSAVYPLNIPKTCGQCHSNNGMAGKHGLAVYPNYIDSIHGFALSKDTEDRSGKSTFQPIFKWLANRLLLSEPHLVGWKKTLYPTYCGCKKIFKKSYEWVTRTIFPIKLSESPRRRCTFDILFAAVNKKLNAIFSGASGEIFPTVSVATF